MPLPLPASARRLPRGFSLVEVILALGIMAVAIVSILGLIGTTLTDVRTTEEISTGTECIEKMNAIIQNAPFWDPSPTGKGESVYNWVLNSTSASPTVFIFYNSIPTSSSDTTGTAPLQRVARLNLNFQSISKPDPDYLINKAGGDSVPQLPVFEPLDDFVTTVTSGRLYGPVIAMTVSVSPLMKNFPQTSSYTVAQGVVFAPGDETVYYTPPTGSSLFPSASSNMPTDPTGFTTGGRLYPEGYLPIYVQAFLVSLTNVQPNEDANTLGQALVSDMTEGNRIFTYTTAKLR